MTRVLAIADDLTGALEVGAKFAAAGMRSVVTAGVGVDLGDAVVVIDTETRHVPADEADAIVASRAAGWVGLVYKKTDSTLRGNIGAELGALHKLYGAPIAYVPAYPDLGRTVVDGWLYVDGVPLAQTAFARDALNPVRDGNVRALLDPACDCVVFDGRTQEDVMQAALTILAGGVRVVAGPAAIAGALAELLGEPKSVEWPRVRRCLVVNGSRHEASAAQIGYAKENDLLQTDWCWFDQPVTDAREAGRAIQSRLRDDVFDGLLVFGGDTAFGILESFGLPLLRPLGEVLPGVPVSRIAGRDEILITKAGGFGAPDLIGRLRSKLG